MCNNNLSFAGVLPLNFDKIYFKIYLKDGHKTRCNLELQSKI